MKADTPGGWRHVQSLRVLHAIQRIAHRISRRNADRAEKIGSAIISFSTTYNPFISQSESNRLTKATLIPSIATRWLAIDADQLISISITKIPCSTWDPPGAVLSNSAISTGLPAVGIAAWQAAFMSRQRAVHMMERSEPCTTIWTLRQRRWLRAVEKIQIARIYKLASTYLANTLFHLCKCIYGGRH
ncbi:hypothetical protein [Burkholderia sp. MSMB1072]|uniref:hypothetical protein n=1 Tax=Burkholderia sp. MSMB1072 TaxID=1637871 RepID=UPI0012E3AAF6|nr:hypothetical protein [Burkholderia sp. MSMB1072]